MNPGPCIPSSIEAWLAPALDMIRGTAKGREPLAPFAVESVEEIVLRCLPSKRRACDDGAVYQLLRFEAAMADGLTGSEQPQPGKAIEEPLGASVERGLQIQPPHLCTQLVLERRHVAELDGVEARDVPRTATPRSPWCRVRSRRRHPSR